MLDRYVCVEAKKNGGRSTDPGLLSLVYPYSVFQNAWGTQISKASGLMVGGKGF